MRRSPTDRHPGKKLKQQCNTLVSQCQQEAALGDHMASLTIPNLPPDLLNRLKERAKANRRSLGKEALVILEEALGTRGWPPTIDELDKLRVRGARPLTQEMLDEARETGRP